MAALVGPTRPIGFQILMPAGDLSEPRRYAMSMELANHTITRARKMFHADLYEDAARDAYLAAFHAARQVIARGTGRAPKTHSGVRKRLHALRHTGTFNG